MIVFTNSIWFWAAVAAWIFNALIIGAMADARNRDGAIWMLIGYVFGPLAYLPIMVFGFRLPTK